MSAPKLLKPPVYQRTKLVVKREAVRLEFSIQATRREAGQIRWICKSGGGDIISDERGDHGTFSLSTRVFHTCGCCANVRVEDVNGTSKSLQAFPPPLNRKVSEKCETVRPGSQSGTLTILLPLLYLNQCPQSFLQVSYQNVRSSTAEMRCAV